MGDLLIKPRRLLRIGVLPGLLALLMAAAPAQVPDFDHDAEPGKLRLLAGDQELFVYNFGADLDLPHFYPLNTPSGKNLLVQETEPYPHHRAFWVADTVVRDGVRGDIYNAYYSGAKAGGKRRTAPFDTAARHVRFDLTTGTEGVASYTEELVWETSRTQSAYPLLDEHRKVRIRALPGGDYLVDFEFALVATYGDVEFVSDPVHYAWPFLRLDKTFSGDTGGTITASNGATGQDQTNMKPAGDDPILWVDYSSPQDAAPEGIAIFQNPDASYGEGPRKWLTREYGTFGPRRPDDQSGAKFTLPRGEALRQRVGIYVHSGDVNSAGVAEMYNRYVKGAL